MQPNAIGDLQPGLVSVVIPCYNAVRFLAATLESAFEQTYSPIEIVVVDDGSTDGSTELIRSFGGRVRAEFGPNRGASAARNRGTTMARGEFIQYLDADDLLAHDAITRRVEALQQTSSDVAYSDWERLVEIAPGTFRTGEQTTRRMEDLDADLSVAQLKFWAPPAALTYRRSMVERIGGWKEWLPIIQDARFLQDASLLDARFVHVPGIGASYRVALNDSLSRRSDIAFIADVYRNGCDLHAFIERKGAMSAAMRRHIAGLYGYTARTLFYCDHAAFRDCVGRLYALEPGFQFTWPKIASFTSSIMGFRAASNILRLLSTARQFVSRFRIQIALIGSSKFVF